jgi:hypothetical protein
MKAPRHESMLDCRPAEPELQELPSGDDAVLPLHQRPSPGAYRLMNLSGYRM